MFTVITGADYEDVGNVYNAVEESISNVDIPPRSNIFVVNGKIIMFRILCILYITGTVNMLSKNSADIFCRPKFLNFKALIQLKI